MDGRTNASDWHSCAGCRKPVDAHRALKLKGALWLCRPCASGVAKAIGRAEHASPPGPMSPTFN